MVIDFNLTATLFLTLIWLAVAAWLRLRRGTGYKRLICLTAFFGYMCVVLKLTLLPAYFGEGLPGAVGRSAWRDANLVPLAGLDAGTALSSIALAAPFGLILPLVKRIKLKSMAIYALTFGAAIEAAQLVIALLGGIVDGQADINGVIFCFLGAMAGYGLLEACLYIYRLGSGIIKPAFNIPNLLSLFRLMLIPVFVSVFFSGDFEGHAIATLIFLVAGATDVIDGRIARKYNQITLLGRILDPLADKLMVLAALICCMIEGAVPIWAVALYSVKEIIQAVCGVLLFRKVKDVPPSNLLGKTGTVAFYFTIAVNLVFDLSPAARYVMLGASFACIFSAFISYIINGISLSRQLRESEQRR